jgi:hypothetical protein
MASSSLATYAVSYAQPNSFNRKKGKKVAAIGRASFPTCHNKISNSQLK